MKNDRVANSYPVVLLLVPLCKNQWFKNGLSHIFVVWYDAQMLDFIDFANFAKLVKREPPLPTIEELPVPVTPLFLS